MGMYDEILAQLGSSGIDQLSRKTGLAPADTSRAVAGALPAILAGLAANSARSSNGAEWLSTALDRDHDGADACAQRSACGRGKVIIPSPPSQR